MRTSWIPSSRACDNRCLFCDARGVLDGAAVPAAVLRGAIDAARASGAERVVFTGGEPTRSADLLRAISYARACGLRVALTTHGRSLSSVDRIGRLQAAGLDEVRISLHGATPDTHNRLVGGDPVAFEQTARAVALCAPVFETTVRMVLTAHNVAEVGAVVALATGHRVAFELIALHPTDPATDPALHLDDDAAYAAWRAAFDACRRHGVPFTHQGFTSAVAWARSVPPAPAAFDDATRALLRARLRDPAMLAGLETPTDPVLAEVARDRGVTAEDLPALLAAEHTPLLPIAHQTSPAVARPLADGTRVLVVVDDHADPIAAASTLPGLVHALTARGVDAHLVSMYRRPFDPETLSARTVAVSIMTPADPRPLGPEDPLSTPATLARASVGLARRLGELGRDVPTLVVFWGFEAAETWRGVPELRDAIVHVIDTGALEGLRSPMGPHDVVHAANPSTARTRAAAIGLGHVRWAPLPAWLPHVAPSSGSGRHLLIPQALFDSALRRWPSDASALPRVRFDARGPADTVGFQLSGARALWVPATDEDQVDLRTISLARAAGLPVIGSLVPSLAEHVRPDDAILVAPGDLDAHARALETLTTDPARLARLRNAARLRREVASVVRLAEAIVHGHHGPLAVSQQTGRGPWWSW